MQPVIHKKLKMHEPETVLPLMLGLFLCAASHVAAQSCVTDPNPPQHLCIPYASWCPKYSPDYCPADYRGQSCGDRAWRACSGKGWNTIYTAPDQFISWTLVKQVFDLGVPTTTDCMGPVTTSTTGHTHANSVLLTESAEATLGLENVDVMAESIAASMGFSLKEIFTWTFPSCQPAVGYNCKPLIQMEGHRYEVESRQIAWKYRFASPARIACTSDKVMSSAIRWQRASAKVVTCYWKADRPQPSNPDECLSLIDLIESVKWCSVHLGTTGIGAQIYIFVGVIGILLSCIFIMRLRQLLDDADGDTEFSPLLEKKVEIPT